MNCPARPPGGGRGMKFRKPFKPKTRKITPARYWAIKEAILIIGFSFGIFLPKPSYFLRCVKTIVVATYIRPKNISPSPSGLPPASVREPGVDLFPCVPTACGGSSGLVRPDD